MILLSLLFQIIFSWSKESRILTFTEKEITTCGGNLSWGVVISGLTNKEKECLDTLSPWSLVLSEEGTSVSKMESRLIESRENVIQRFKKGRSACLNSVEVVIPDRIKIKSEPQLTLASLEPWILSELSFYSSDKKIEFNRVSLPKIDCAKAKQIQWSSFKIEGRNQFRFLLNADEKNFWITGEFRWWQKVPVARRNLAPNEKLTIDDLELQSKDTTFATSYASKIEDLLGRTTQQVIAQGSVIDTRFLKVENLVEKGQVIQIQFQGDNFVVSSQAQAEQSGSRGDLIKIKNLDTQKILSGIVLGKGLVEVK